MIKLSKISQPLVPFHTRTSIPEPMNRRILHFPFSILHCLLLLSGCYREQSVPVTTDFTVAIEDNDYSVPVRIAMSNLSSGADHYQWTFEGGEPATSDKKNPDKVVYRTAGTYTIRLEAWNNDERQVKDFILVLDSAVNIGFEVEIPINNISPVQAIITNTTRGAVSWLWTFENGNPAMSDQADPPSVIFTIPGEHTIHLKVSNGREQFSLSKTITVLPAMVAGFEIKPSFDDTDMEAPWKATLTNTTINGLNWLWKAPGGSFSDPTAESPQVYFPSEGIYDITLEAQNGKEIQTVTQTVTISANSNLYTETDVKLGCSIAHTTIGCFYSCTQRKVITQNDMAALRRSSRITYRSSLFSVDLVFFGIGPSFSYCRFISPSQAQNAGFDIIPDASQTYFVNTLDKTDISFTVADFDKMTTDTPLRNLSIKNNDTGEAYFNTQTPHIILFETATGRKGAIKIKGFISEGYNSYILADMKIMKN